MSIPAVSIAHISKIFSRSKNIPLHALDDITLTIEPGAIYGLLGPNGAGKSTLINVISGVLLPTSGTLEVFGVDVVKDPVGVKQLLGVVPQEVVVEMAFTVEEVLYYFCGMYGVPASQRQARITSVLEELSLSDKQHERARSLSGGMKRRLMIAKAVLHKPKLLILDEPTAGVDVELRQRIWAMVRRLKAEGTTIVFTTHYLEEAEQLCDMVSVINHGRVIKEGRVKDMQQEFSKNSIHFELFDRTVLPAPGVRSIGVEFEYPMKNLANDMRILTTYYGDNLKSIRSESASLEQIFLELTKT